MKSLLQDRNSAQRKDRTSDITVRWSGTVAVCRAIVNRRSRLAGVLFAVIVAPLLAQTPEPLQEARLREMARQSARDAKGDPTELVLALDRRVRARYGDFETFPLTIVRNDDLLIAVTAPYMAFRTSLIDMLRTGRSIDRALWTNQVTVSVTPNRLGAPDIETVAVSRNDRPVAATRNALRPMRFSNGAGEEGVVHAGEIGFPPAAFAPGGTVVMTLTPHAGSPIVHAFTEFELRTLR